MPAIWPGLGSSGFTRSSPGCSVSLSVRAPFQLGHHRPALTCTGRVSSRRNGWRGRTRWCVEPILRRPRRTGPMALRDGRTVGRRLRSARPAPLASPERLRPTPIPDREREFAQDRFHRARRSVSPEAFRPAAVQPLERTGADELISPRWSMNIEDRIRSFDLIADTVRGRLAKTTPDQPARSRRGRGAREIAQPALSLASLTGEDTRVVVCPTFQGRRMAELERQRAPPAAPEASGVESSSNLSSRFFLGWHYQCSAKALILLYSAPPTSFYPSFEACIRIKI